MMTPEDQRLLKQNKLFDNVDMEHLVPVLEDCAVVIVSSGEKLLEMGQENDSLYLVMEGELHVYLDSYDLTEHAVIEAGACTGELSLIDGRATSALVLAAKETRVAKLPYHHVWALVDSSNGVARNLLSILAGRIRSDNLARLTSNERSLEFEVAYNVDALTGLHNRSWMDDAFPRMMLRCERNGQPACMLMADIDNFKSFNQEYGRGAGDMVLRVVARLMAEKLRPQDLLVYLGTDKFAVLLPETGVEVATRVATRLCEEMEKTPLNNAPGDELRTSRSAKLNKDTRMTMSVGIAEMQPGETLNAMFSKAHVALYRAKSAGKNQVAV